MRSVVNTPKAAFGLFAELVELELQHAVSCHVGAGNSMQVLCKSSWRSQLQNHLSSSMVDMLRCWAVVSHSF